MDTRRTPTGEIIGTTFGLATTEYHGKGCEQAYVKETGDEQRPIRLEFWEGYAVPNHAMLTKKQAIQLAFIILGWATNTKTSHEEWLGRTVL